MKKYFLILILILNLLLSSCDEPKEFIFDANTMSEYSGYNDNEYWTNEIMRLRNSLNLTRGEVLSVDITLSIISGADNKVDIIITKGYNTLFDEFLLRLYKNMYRLENLYKDFEMLRNAGEVVLRFELGDTYLSVLYLPEKTI